LDRWSSPAPFTAIPNLRYHEVETSKLVRKTLDELGHFYRYPIAETGVVATLRAATAVRRTSGDMGRAPDPRRSESISAVKSTARCTPAHDCPHRHVARRCQDC